MHANNRTKCRGGAYTMSRNKGRKTARIERIHTNISALITTGKMRETAWTPVEPPMAAEDRPDSASIVSNPLCCVSNSSASKFNGASSMPTNYGEYIYNSGWLLVNSCCLKHILII